MNQKKVKALKKALKAQGVDINERVYDERGAGVQVDHRGNKTPVTGTVYLRKGCGRQIYQSMKG